jgi:hypothetical protein
MNEPNAPGAGPEFDTGEGLSLAVSYLENPSAIPCPRCGPGTIEVVAYLEAAALREGRKVYSPPEGEYVVVLVCHVCEQGAALTFRSTEEEGRRAA